MQFADPTPKAVQGPDGRIYRSVGRATHAAGVSRPTMAKLLRTAGSGWSLIDGPAATSDGKPLRYGNTPKPILSPNGHRYPSLKAAAAAAGVCISAMTRRCQAASSGWSYADVEG